MKKSLIFLCATIFCIAINAQDYQRKIDSLNQLKNQLTDRIVLINNEILDYSNKINQTKIQVTTNIQYTLTAEQTLLKDGVTHFSNIVSKIPKGSVVTLLDYDSETQYWAVEYQNVKGYINEVFITDNKQTSDFKKPLVLMHQADSQRKADSLLIAIYGSDIVFKIKHHEVWIGMTDEMCVKSIGVPESKNRDTYAFGIHEQWVYKNKYVYFEDGICTTIQEQH